MSKTPESQMDDCNVVCPYCGAAYQPEGEDFSETEREEECYVCKRVYLLYDEFSVTHYTRAKEGA